MLRSNSGEAHLAIDLATSAEYAHDAGFESSISIRGEHWDGDHTLPLTSSVESLWLRSDGLTELSEHIVAWINQPLDQLIPERLDGAFELARLPSQSLAITFGSRPGTIAHLNPGVSISLKAGAFHCDFHFVTDQSCLAMFVQELASQLQPNGA